MTKYPFFKVILAFSLVPIWGGLSMGLIMLFTSEYPVDGGLFLKLWFHFVMLLLSMAVAMFFEVIPAMILAVCYALIKLKQGMTSYFLVFICGGAGAYVCTDYLFGLGGGAPLARFEFIRPFFLQNLPSKAFVLGALFSLLTAIVVLPPKVTRQKTP